MVTMEKKYTLITNLDYVTVGAVRTHTHALLISRTEHPVMRREVQYLLRGFHVSASLPTFDLEVASDDFEFFDEHNLWSGKEGEVRPLLRSAVMRLAMGPYVQLVAGVNSQDPIDVHSFAPGTGILAVWDILTRKVLQHWTAPYFQAVYTLPIEEARQIVVASVGGSRVTEAKRD